MPGPPDGDLNRDRLPDVDSRVTTRALVLAVALFGIGVSLRSVAPALLLGVEGSLLAGTAGLLLAVGVGYYRGGVLVGVLVAVLPVFGVDAASTALSEPVTLDLAARAARRAAWYTLGVAVLLTGPSGYAIGAATRSRAEVRRFDGDLRTHLTVARADCGPLLAWGLAAGGAVVSWPVLSAFTTTSSVVAAPVFTLGGLVVAAFFGYRGPGALPSVISSSIGLVAGVLLYTQGLVLVGSGTGGRPAGLFAGTIVLVGVAAGIPYGLVGYTIGRLLDG